MPSAAIKAFWEWWATIAPGVVEALDDGDLGKRVDEISERVKAIDDGLEWELGPGLEAKYQLCLTGVSDPGLRQLAERWLRAAPEADDTWEYHPARQPIRGDRMKGFELDFDGQVIDFAALGFALEVDDEREKIDLSVGHTGFTGMDDSARERAAFVVLDSLLGEDGVERWLGTIDVVPGPLEEGVSLEEMLEQVDQLEQRSNGDGWVRLGADHTDGAFREAVANLALKRIDFPLYDLHTEVRFDLLKPTEQGLTNSEEDDDIDQLIGELVQDLADSALFAGHETEAGRRTLHFYVLAESNAPEALRRWQQRHPEYSFETETSLDPRWEEVPWQ